MNNSFDRKRDQKFNGKRNFPSKFPPKSEEQQRAEKLAKLKYGQAVANLCRLAKFNPHSLRSKNYRAMEQDPKEQSLFKILQLVKLKREDLFKTLDYLKKGENKRFLSSSYYFGVSIGDQITEAETRVFTAEKANSFNSFWAHSKKDLDSLFSEIDTFFDRMELADQLNDSNDWEFFDEAILAYNEAVSKLEPQQKLDPSCQEEEKLLEEHLQKVPELKEQRLEAEVEFIADQERDIAQQAQVEQIEERIAAKNNSEQA